MKEVNADLVKKNLDLQNVPIYLNWNSVVKNLNSINLPQNHILRDACSTEISCEHPPGKLNSGVPRVLMPEVNKDVMEKIRGKIPFTEHKITVKELASSYVAQREILLPKIKGQANSHKSGKFNLLDNTWYVATAADGKKVIIDGHHGWGALNLLLKAKAIDPEALVNIVDFSSSPEKVIEMAFNEGDAHSNPFRPEIIGGRKQKTNRRKVNRRNTRRKNSAKSQKRL
jgi:hypothetical protein